ncbi:MAG: hypothetical protein IPI49_29395 [Myxococcales bacterium]|nr:hypothetical protein [Myxococcales bacterium]
MARGVWELSTLRLEDLRAALLRLGAAPCTETALQAAGFESAQVTMLCGVPATHALVVVDAVLADRRAHPPPGLDLVWSGPEAARSLSRDTAQVLRELFARAERHVIVAGFAFWDAQAIFEPLVQRARAVAEQSPERGLEIEFYIHLDATGRDRSMTPAAFFRHSWPWVDVMPAVYYDARTDDDRADRADDAAPPTSSMHAKCVILDEAATLITSANFTSAAHTRNIELGVLVRDETFAARAGAQWRSLVARGLFRRLERG